MTPYNEALEYLVLLDAGPSLCSLMEVNQFDQELLQVSSVQMLHLGVLFVTVVRFLLFSLLVLLAIASGIFSFNPNISLLRKYALRMTQNAYF